MWTNYPPVSPTHTQTSSSPTYAGYPTPYPTAAPGAAPELPVQTAAPYHAAHATSPIQTIPSPTLPPASSAHLTLPTADPAPRYRATENPYAYASPGYGGRNYSSTPSYNEKDKYGGDQGWLAGLRRWVDGVNEGVSETLENWGVLGSGEERGGGSRF